MSVAEVLASIVERACLYVPEAPVGAANIKRPKALTEFEKFSKEALTADVKVYPKEAFSKVKKVPAASVASNLVRFK